MTYPTELVDPSEQKEDQTPVVKKEYVMELELTNL